MHSLRFLVFVLAPLAVGCGGGEGAPADADEGMACINSGRGDTFVVGLDRQGRSGLLDFKLMSATPAPPGFEDNTWILQINEMSGGVVGAPAAGATLIVTPFMPDHQHGTLKVNVEALAEPGQYKLAPIHMWMPGLWETTIQAQAGAVTDSAVFKFCIQA